MLSTHCWQNGLDGALAIYYNDNGKDRCRFSFISPECLVNEQGFPKEKQTDSDLYGLSPEEIAIVERSGSPGFEQIY